MGGSFTLAGDSGDDQTIANGNTMTIAGGAGLATVGSATDTVTINLDIDGMSTAITGIADADLVIVDDGANGTNRAITRGNFLALLLLISNGLTSTTLSASGDTDLNGALNVEGRCYIPSCNHSY